MLLLLAGAGGGATAHERTASDAVTAVIESPLVNRTRFYFPSAGADTFSSARRRRRPRPRPRVRCAD